MSEARIRVLSEQIAQHNIAYYQYDDPTISDAEYDALYRELVDLETQFPHWRRPDSPTQVLMVAPSTVSGLAKVQHRTPLLSIDNTFSADGIGKFDRDMTALSGQAPEYAAEYKYDGLAISLWYSAGRLVQAATRGDHQVGEDVTANAYAIEGIPKVITYLGDLDVRGEILMPTAAFLALNEQRAASGEKLLVNARNAAAGAMRLLDARETGRRGLIFRAYAISDATLPDDVTTQQALVHWLSEHGFPSDPVTVCHGVEGIAAHFESVSEHRHTLPFDIDGVVFKLNDLALQHQAGTTARTPRAMIAYKFNQQEAVTVVEAIQVQVGRTGALTPVAILAPVTVGDVTVTRATLHNENELRRLDVRVGDLVTVRRNGDVIPGVTRVHVDARPPSGRPEFVMPSACPCCAAPTAREGDEAVLRCTGDTDCDEQMVQRLVYFAARPALNIDGLGESTVRDLFNAGLVRTPDQLYDLTRNDILRLPGFADKSADNLIAAIHASRRPTLQKFLVALGISNASTGTAKRLAENLGSITAIRRADYATFTRIRDIGPIVADSLVRYFDQPAQQRMLDRLMTHLTVQDEPGKVITNSPLTGKTLVITGTLPGMSRDEAKVWAEQLGATVSGSVSKRTDYLLCGEDAGTKLDRARALSVPVMTLDEMRQFVNGSPRSDVEDTAGADLLPSPC